MTIKIENLNTTEQNLLVDVTTTELHEIHGGAIGVGALSGALSSIGGLSPDIPKAPSAREFLGSTFVGAAIPAIGIAATVASGGTVPLLVAGASLQG